MLNIIAGDVKRGPSLIEHVKKTCNRCGENCWVSANLLKTTKYPHVICVECLSKG